MGRSHGVGEVGGWTRRRVLGGAAATSAAILVSGAAACGPARRIFVVGDSLTVGAQGQGLGEATDGGDAGWTIDAEVGRTTHEATAVLAATDLTGFELVIVALGTNDYLDSASMYGVRIDRLMAALDGHPKVCWINVDAHTTKLRPAATGVNPALAAAPSRHPSLRVADWHAHLGARSDAATLRASDGVHYTASGYRVRREFTQAVAG